MITVAEVLASFIPAKHLWEEFAMLRGCSGWCPNPRPLFASFTGGKKSHRLCFLHPRRKSRAGRIAKEIRCYIILCDCTGQRVAGYDPATRRFEIIFQIVKMAFKAGFEGELFLSLSLGPWDPGLLSLVHKDTPIFRSGVRTVGQRRGRVPGISSLG